MRLIDADALKEDLTRFYANEVTARDLIDEQPTIDAVPVVRCKDCKHGKPMVYTHAERPCICIICSHLGSGFYERVFKPMWFCADGEKVSE